MGSHVPVRHPSLPMHGALKSTWFCTGWVLLKQNIELAHVVSQHDILFPAADHWYVDLVNKPLPFKLRDGGGLDRENTCSQPGLSKQTELSPI